MRYNVRIAIMAIACGRKKRTEKSAGACRYRGIVPAIKIRLKFSGFFRFRAIRISGKTFDVLIRGQ